MPMLVHVFLFIGLSQSLNCFVCCCHLLKDTASGAPQHALCMYLGTSATAEGNASEQLVHLKVHMQLVSGVCCVQTLILLFSIHHTIHNSTLQTQYIGQ